MKIKAKAELELRKRYRGRLDTMSLPDYVKIVNNRYQWYSHVTMLAGLLDMVAAGDLKRLMIFMPPRHGKSELVCRLFSAYYLLKHPEQWVAICSYGSNLAHGFSRQARENYKRAGGLTKRDADSVTLWRTNDVGGLWAAGVGGPATGKGFHLGIIDDPVKNAEEAASLAIQTRNNEWYESTFYTRQEPDAAIVIIQTRWNDADLSGYILGREFEEPESWHIVHFEALKDEAAPEYPPTCTLEMDGRMVGDALNPERYDEEKLRQIKARIGSYFFNALYQQRPRPREGGMFKQQWFQIVPDLPHRKDLKFCRYWDKAGTKDAGAHTAGVLMAVTQGRYFVVDLLMGQWSSGEREKIIRQTAVLDSQEYSEYGHYYVGVEQEPGSGGKESAENTIKNLAGFSAFKDRVSGDKILRAEPLAAQAEAGNLFMLEGRWNRRYIDIMTAFPTGTIKDPVDASSGSFSFLVSRGPQVRHLRGLNLYGSRNRAFNRKKRSNYAT